MKLRNIIRSFFLQESKKEFKHISALETQILAKVREEKELEIELNKSYTPIPQPFWAFRFPLAFALILIIVFSFGIIVNTPVVAKGSILDTLINLKNQLQQELTHLLGNDPAYRDKSTQKYKQAQQEWCSVSARAPEEQEKAVAAIREFLDRPDADVKYECIKNPNDNSEEARPTETYIVDFDRFVIDIQTNHVIEMSEKEGSWGENKDGSHWSSPQKQYDYTARYTKEELEQLARDFIVKHEKALGKIELSNLTLEAGTKNEDPGKINYFFVWKGTRQVRKLKEPYKTCSKDVTKDEADSYDENGVPCVIAYEDAFTPQVSLTFTQGGQMVSFSNELNSQPEK